MAKLLSGPCSKSPHNSARCTRLAAEKMAEVLHVELHWARRAFLYRDTADRFLLATAKVFGLTLVTADERLLKSRDVSMLANR